MGVWFEPSTRFNNNTEEVMVVDTVEENSGIVESSMQIKSGGHAYMWYRKGMERKGHRITFWVHPHYREHPQKSILPYQVHKSADIDISYKLPHGRPVPRNCQPEVSIDLQFREDSEFRRIGLVRWVTARCDSVTTAFGGCFAAHGTNSVEAPLGSASAPLGPTSAHIQAPLGSASATSGPATAPNQAPSGSTSAPIQAPPAGPAPAPPRPASAPIQVFPGSASASAPPGSTSAHVPCIYFSK